MDLNNNYITFPYFKRGRVETIKLVSSEVANFRYFKNDDIYEYLKLDFGMNNVEQHYKVFLYHTLYEISGSKKGVFLFYFNELLYENHGSPIYGAEKNILIDDSDVDLIEDNSYYSYEDYEPVFKYIDWCLENNLPPIEADTEELYNINTRI